MDFFKNGKWKRPAPAFAIAMPLLLLALAGAVRAGDHPRVLTGDAAVLESCGLAIDTVENYYRQDNTIVREGFASWLVSQGRDAASAARTAMCAGLAGRDAGGFDADSLLENAGRRSAVSLAAAGADFARGTGLPFLNRLEVETGFRSGDAYWEVLSVQPLWSDAARRHHFFTQVSWNHAYVDEELTGAGWKDTLNGGLAWRYLTPSETVMWGANAFWDHNLDYDHNRLSLGADVQTSLLGASANRYLPMTGWRSVDALVEERAIAGWDMEVRGQVPALPAWTAFAKGYQWQGYDGREDIYGMETRVEWAPVQGLRLSAGAGKENGDDIEARLGLRFVLDFAQGLKEHMQPVTHLATVRDRVYDKVRRENTIRVQQRLKKTQPLPRTLAVVSTAGANSYVAAAGSGALAAGMTLQVPVTVTTANSAGAVAVLRFEDNALLSLGQGTQVEIAQGLVTLVQGVMQYVSGSGTVTVNVPGGTVTLLGTDLDVIAAGAAATVRVRDGSVRVTGDASGEETVTAGQGAAVSSGAVTAMTSGQLETHGDTISRLLDRQAPVRDDSSHAPYSPLPHALTANGDTVGDTIEIQVVYSKPVTVTGTPLLQMEINGIARTASYVSGSGSADLRFSYTLQAADAGATELVAGDIDLNGGAMLHAAQKAVSSLADTVLALDGAVANAGQLTNCPNPGDVCDEGPLYAGEFNGNKIYVAAADTGPSLPWNNGNAAERPDVPELDNCGWMATHQPCFDGASNTQTLAQVTAAAVPGSGAPYEAAMACVNSAAHGFTDWFLPSQDELEVVYHALGPFPANGFKDSGYWTSSEYNDIDAINRYFGADSDGPYNKASPLYVRCIRTL